jgi:hypothetical protein
MMYRQRLNRRGYWLAMLGCMTGTVLLAWAVCATYANMRDRRVARDAEREVVTALKAMAAGHALTQRYGLFVRLDGEGYQRSRPSLGGVFRMADGPGAAPIHMQRTAAFAQARVMLVISVGRGERVEMEKFLLSPNEDAVAAGTQLTIENGESWCIEDVDPYLRRMDGLKKKRRSMILAFVQHPKCPR